MKKIITALSKLNRKMIIKFAIISLLIVGTVIFRSEIMEVVELFKNRDALILQFKQYGSLGVVILSLLIVLQVIVAAFPGHALILAGGYFYGFLFGFLLTHVSTVFGSEICYYLARTYGRPIVEKFASAESVEKWSQKAERQGLMFFLFSFNIPIFPADLMNYVAGVSGLSPKKFFIANFFGRLPASILLPLIGAYGFEIPPQILGIAIVLTVVLLFAWKFISPKLKQNFDKKIGNKQS